MLLSLCLLSSVAVARPAPEPDPMPNSGSAGEARLLYPVGQVYKHGDVFPIVLELFNPGSQARVFEVKWKESLPLPASLSSPRLEPGERRRFPLYFPRNEIGGAHTIEVNGQVYAFDLQACHRSTITALLSPAEQKFDYLRTLKLEPDPSAAATADTPAPLVPLSALPSMDAEVLPENWAMLSCLDVIIAYDLQSLSLSSAQQSALLSWVRQGGRLVLVSDGRPEEFRGTPFEPHLPLVPSGTATGDGLLRLVGTVAPGATTLQSHEGQPLLLRRPLMLGSIFLITAPLTELSPLSIAQAEQLWQATQPSAVEDPAVNYNSYNYRYQKHASLVSNVLTDMPELPRTNPAWVALFLLFYAIIVGPVNLGVLRRQDKMLWSFVTVPAIAVLFAGSAYLVNRINRADTVVLRELGLLQLQSGDSHGYGCAEALLYSPSAGVRVLTSTPETIAHPSTYNYSQTSPFGMYLPASDGGLQASIAMSTWDVFPLNVESMIALPTPVTGRWHDGTLTVDSPLKTEGAEAMVYHPGKGSSQLFRLQGGRQTEKLRLTEGEEIDLLAPLGLTADPHAHPGRERLVTSLAGNSNATFSPEATYLLFWSQQTRATVEPEAPGVHRGEYLVIVELTP